MAHRDPETGQFVAESDQFTDYEVVSFQGNATIAASELTGDTTKNFGQESVFEGLELLDYDDVVDRNEELHLLSAQHRGAAYIKSTSTSDGTVRAVLEVSAAPSLSTSSAGVGTPAQIESNNLVTEGLARDDDTIDLIGRQLISEGFAPFSDGGTGVGGAGSVAADSVSVSGLPEVLARFHPRDELFMNGRVEVQNVSDASVSVEVSGQHVYGVMMDD